MYKPNPKLEGSNIIACVPQDGFCPIRCPDCFFNRPGNYLGDSPKANIPPLSLAAGKIVRINDVNDSNNDRETVMNVALRYKDKFFNTSIPRDLEGFRCPVVLTANPGRWTDKIYHQLDPIPDNLMFVRARVNTWNLDLVDRIVDYYTDLGVPVVLTFMAYYETPIPESHRSFYQYKKRTLNEYWCVRDEMWWALANRYIKNLNVITCGSHPRNHKCGDCRVCETAYKISVKRLGLPSAFV